MYEVLSVVTEINSWDCAKTYFVSKLGPNDEKISIRINAEQITILPTPRIFNKILNELLKVDPSF